MKTEYKDPERVACLKRDWADLCPTDQASLLVEWGEETAADFKKDRKAKLLAWGKWLLLALAGAVAAASIPALTSCTEVTPAQMQTAHALYHVVSGQPCILIVDGETK